MADFTPNYFSTTPFGSLVLIADDQQREQYLQQYVKLPSDVSLVLTSSATGAYIRGLTKQFNLSTDLASYIALMIFEVAIGVREFKDLAVAFQSELSIPNTTAQLMAQDIEKELFASVSLDLNNYLAQKQPQTNLNDLPPNTLDLKNINSSPDKGRLGGV